MRIFEARYLDMVANCLRNEEAFVLDPLIPDHSNNHLSPIGTTAKITEWNKEDNSSLQILVEGLEKVTVENLKNERNGLLIGEVTEKKDQDSPLSPEILDFLEKNEFLNNAYGLTEIVKHSTILATYKVASLNNLTIKEKLSVLREKSGVDKFKLLMGILKNRVSSDMSGTLH